MGAPEPEEIYESTKEEGERRLQRPFLELVTTSFAAGFDIAAGVAVMGLVAAALSHHFGTPAAHVAGAIGFGVGFVFLVVGRGELFTENFLVPLAGLEGKGRRAWLKLAELWTISPVCNILAGLVVALLLTIHGVLPYGTGKPLLESATRLHGHTVLQLFVSAVFAGALITAMTWFVEGQTSMGIRVTVAWIAGMILALGGFNHVIVISVELIYGIRYGAHIPWEFVLGNFGLAAAGNMLGGIGLVTLNRFTQARSR
ncbi:MAG: formate/nitrite transporter family protein [Actinobacteria bacterium]|nr:formate/nitrite transporter family protein [Actinomycetota bacterium]